MKAGFLFSVVLLLTSPGVAGDEPKQAAGADELRELRNQCYAHFFFTAALGSKAGEMREDLLNKAIALDPGMARAYFHRGTMYLEADKLPRARADFKKAIELNENFIYAHYNLACMYAMDSEPAAALANLENALAKGYLKFDNIPKDSDLKSIHNNPALAPLIAKYRAIAAATRPSALQQFQNSDVDQRTELLAAELRAPGRQSAEVALWAIHDANYAPRVLGMHLWRKLDVAESKSVLVRGLYDGNGYVCKAAANDLITYGKEIEPLMSWVLEDRGSPAPFFAMQVLAAIGAPNAADKIVPYLRDKDPMVRLTAADSLARLGAVSALPELEAALANLPEDEKRQAFYKASLVMAIAKLKAAKDKGGH